jgi:hypothetical protein
VELVDLKIQLDNLRLAMDDAFANRRSMAELKKLHIAIRKREKQLLKHVFLLN